MGYEKAGVSGRDVDHDQYDPVAGPCPARQTLPSLCAPYGHWKTTAFIADLRHDGVSAPIVVDGPIDGALFLAWIRDFLCPTLRPGDIVIADNLSCHKVSGVQQA